MGGGRLARQMGRSRCSPANDIGRPRRLMGTTHTKNTGESHDPAQKRAAVSHYTIHSNTHDGSGQGLIRANGSLFAWFLLHNEMLPYRNRIGNYPRFRPKSRGCPFGMYPFGVCPFSVVKVVSCDSALFLCRTEHWFHLLHNPALRCCGNARGAATFRRQPHFYPILMCSTFYSL